MPQDIMRLPALTSTAAYQALEIHAHDARDWQMRQLFQKDPGRFPRMTVDAAGLFLDYSKNRADDETIKLLVHLARTRGVAEIYLLTNTAERFFERVGYQRMPRDSAPAAIRTTQEFAALCPASAALMRKRLA